MLSCKRDGFNASSASELRAVYAAWGLCPLAPEWLGLLEVLFCPETQNHSFFQSITSSW